ncbi:hypothetical protein HGI81_04180 [Olsenella sp. KGMB02461]|nr:hypothetical protein [Olsenella sp. KGMB02461]
MTKKLTIDRGKTLTIPENTRFTVPEGVSLINEGTIRDNGIVIKDGAIINNGTILCKVTKKLHQYHGR